MPLPTRLAAVLALLLATAPLPAQTPADSLTAQVARALADEGLAGATWALVTPDRVTLGAAGRKDIARDLAMHPDDRVQVGSVAKTFIATGVLRLVTLGRLSLDDPITKHLPDLSIENPWAERAPLRVRHLLDHTAGLDDARMWQVFTLRGNPDAPLRTGLSHGNAPVRVRHTPGARFSYSNTGYLIAAMLIEQLTGERYEAWLERELLAPLGMHRSTFHFVSQVGAQADTSMAMGYFDGVIANASYAIPVRPASQFATTAQDMATFARFLMSDGVVNGASLVHDSLLRAMAVPTTTEAVQAGLSAGYALGLVRRERWGITGHCHLGNIGTFRAIFCLYPEHERAFFLSFNTDPEEANFDRVDSLVASALGVPQTPALVAAPIGVKAAEWTGWYLVRPSRFAQFAYLDDVAGLTRIVWEDSALMLRPLQGTVRALHPVGGALFRLAGRRAATHVVSMSADGARIVTDGQRTFERVSPARVLALGLSAVLGVIALLYLLLVGGVRAVRAWQRRDLTQEPLTWTAASLVLLVLAPLLYLTQPFLAIGDPTIANRAVATCTALLPVALLLSLTRSVSRASAARWRWPDRIALVAALQWCVVLAAWGLLPLMLWR
jgi:CubicO group peptidase (beta-lactamase class C family)